MVLGFKQKFPWGEQTFFKERILAGRGYMYAFHSMSEGLKDIFEPGRIKIPPKIHTFREDKHDRWKAGRSIQMVYRGPKYSILDHFNKDIPELEKCVSTQKIKLWFTGSRSRLEENKHELFLELHAIVDGKRIDNPAQLVVNDGFDNIIQFSKWFKGTWGGKIIHWTDFRY